MEFHFFAQAAKFLQEQKRYKRWMALFLCMAVVVALGTAAALKLNGRAMTKTQKMLNCSLTLHTHVPECYDGEENLICGYADFVIHTHNEDCYDESGTLFCQLPEQEAHIHTDECYAEQEVLTCSEEESEGHLHADECYTAGEASLVCGLQEHAHTEECLGADGLPVCGLEEHAHAEACYGKEQVLICEIEEGEGAHAHKDGCYEMQKVLACGMIELHLHTEECQNEEGYLTCGLLQLEEHTHGTDCFEIIESVVADIAAAETEELSVTEEPAETEAPTEMEETQASEETEELTDTQAAETPLADDGELITKTCQSDSYIITASYYEKANIPPDASLIAEQITPENNKAYYEEREAKYKEITADENASMKALFKIGFYLDGTEIEPKAPVTITVQLLDKDGLPEGAPVTVVHFAEEGEEVLDGGNAQNGSASFQMNSFSDIAIGVSTAEAPQEKPDYVDLNEDYEYKDDMFKVTFHVEGRVTLKQEENGEAAAGEDEGFKSPMDDPEMMEDGHPAEESQEEEESEASSDEAQAEEESVTSSEEVPAEEEGKAPAKEAEAEHGSKVSAEEAEAENETAADGAEAGTERESSVNNAGAEQDSDERVDESIEESGSSDGDDRTEESAGENSDDMETAEGMTEFQVEPLDPKSEVYAAVMNYTKKMNIVNASGMMRALSFRMVYDGVELDLSECKVTARIVPGEAIEERLEAFEDGAKQQAITIAAVEVLEDEQVSKLDTVVLTDTAKKKSMTAELQGGNLTVYGQEMLDPEFTVQYYAYMNLMATSKTTEQPEDSEPVELIDTSNNENGTRGKLPTNTANLPEMVMYVKKTGEITYPQTVKWKVAEPIYIPTLQELYTEQTFNYVNYPALENFDKFRDRKSKYEVSSVWILKDGKQPDSINEDDWNIYENPNELKFTNNPAAANENIIYIKSDMVIRLVANPTTGGFNNDAAFYDYDITDGNVYLDAGLTQIGTRDSKQTLYANTKRQGINNVSNYGSGTLRYGFGNANTGLTGLHNDQLNGFYINKANGVKDVYRGCSFGLVENKLKGDYPDIKAVAPKIFGFEPQIGKEVIPGFSLSFKRDGDVHTLTAVNGTNTKDLDKLQYAGASWSGINRWTNQFWPMDSSVKTFGTDGHDLKFGNKELGEKRQAVGEGTASFPVADDNQEDHNSYFGMNFAIDFELTQDYVGPLNYYFFGDDDMWVFLDGHLVCDIGGVHTSAGEYVDLWDWIPKSSTDTSANANGIKKAGPHTLKFFYTERGASGSTCWMQYTLPSVSSVPVDYFDQNYKHTLTVNKKVEDIGQTDKEFAFTIRLMDKDGQPLYNYYSYKIMDKNNEQVDGGSIKDGDTFKLKQDYSIIIRNLPDGAKYTITEEENRHYETTTQIGNGPVKPGTEASGDIDWDRDDEVTYINKALPFELPETGGVGGMLYTIAGVFGVMSGTGFLYRKKFGERRA